MLAIESYLEFAEKGRSTLAVYSWLAADYGLIV
jgi:hypothetical protein